MISYKVRVKTPDEDKKKKLQVLITNWFYNQALSTSIFHFEIVTVKIFAIPVGEFSNTIFIKGCRQLAENDLHVVLKIVSQGSVVLKTCLRVSKKVKITQCLI